MPLDRIMTHALIIALYSRYTAACHKLKALHGDRAGLSTVEYIIILILIAVVAIGLWRLFGQQVQFQIRRSTTGVNSL